MRKENHAIDGYKICTRCGKRKPVSEFYKRANSKDGYDYYCKKCKFILNKMYYERSYPFRKKKQKYNQKAYEDTDYLPKKYLKRYRASLEKVLKKKEQLLEELKENGKLPHSRKVRLLNYEDSIKRWKRKIAEVEKAIADYAEEKSRQEEKKQEKQEPIINNNMEEQKTEAPKEKNAMTKKDLIRLLKDIPDEAQIIYVGEVGNKSSLVAVWHPDHDSVCIRNLTRKMPYIFTKGALFDLASGAVPTEYDAKNMDSIEEE